MPCPGGDPGNTGAGTGPWVGADLESGMYYGGGEQSTVNNRSQPLTSPFVSLHLKGKTDGFVLKGGDASKGSYQTMYDAGRVPSRGPKGGTKDLTSRCASRARSFWPLVATTQTAPKGTSVSEFDQLACSPTYINRNARIEIVGKSQSCMVPQNKVFDVRAW